MTTDVLGTTVPATSVPECETAAGGKLTEVAASSHGAGDGRVFVPYVYGASRLALRPVIGFTGNR